LQETGGDIDSETPASSVNDQFRGVARAAKFFQNGPHTAGHGLIFTTLTRATSTR
jgi:hypothetical protein